MEHNKVQNLKSGRTALKQLFSAVIFQTDLLGSCKREKAETSFQHFHQYGA